MADLGNFPWTAWSGAMKKVIGSERCHGEHKNGASDDDRGFLSRSRG
jgi:hypothetical protein